MPERRDYLAEPAINCLERLAFHRMPTTAQETEYWRDWYDDVKRRDSSWPKRLAEELGTDFADGEQNTVTIAALRKATLSYDLRSLASNGRKTLRLHSPTRLADQEMLIAMRISELLCVATCNYEVSPAGFPLGYADSSWARWSRGPADSAWDAMERRRCHRTDEIES